MINRFVVRKGNDEILELSLRKPETVYVKDVDGLTPGSSTISTSSIATSNIDVYNTSRRGKRNITMTLGLIANPTIEASRLKLYKFFTLQSKINLMVETENRVLSIDCYVESLDVDIFSREVEADISLIAPDPYFRTSEVLNIGFGESKGSFEFPFSNESLSENLIEFGLFTPGESLMVDYSGDVQTGFKLGIVPTSDMTGSIIFADILNDEFVSLSLDTISEMTGSQIKVGDVIEVSSVNGDKYIRLYRDGVYTNILNSLQSNSTWLSLRPGGNAFNYIVEGGGSATVYIESEILYEGV